MTLIDGVLRSSSGSGVPLSPEVFEQELWDLLEKKSKQVSPVYEKMVNGSLSREGVLFWATQIYFNVVEFKRYLSAIHASCPYPDVELMMIENLWEEIGFGEPKRDHPSIMLTFCRALGGTDEGVKNTERLPETTAFIDHFFHVTRNGSFLEGFAAVGLGIEGNPYARGEKLPSKGNMSLAEIFEKHYGLDEEGNEMWVLHGVEDVTHSRRAMEVVTRYATTVEEQQAVRNQILAATQLFKMWNDGISRAIAERGL